MSHHITCYLYSLITLSLITDDVYDYEIIMPVPFVALFLEFTRFRTCIFIIIYVAYVVAEQEDVDGWRYLSNLRLCLLTPNTL